MNYIIFIIGLVALIIGSITDLRKREVPDWLNYGLMFVGIGVSLLFSIIYSDYHIILGSITGFLLMFLLGSLMFYTGQWGGGDSKMLMGLGALLGLPIIFPLRSLLYFWKFDLPLLFIFIIYVMVVGAFYGLLWSIGLAIIHRKAFIKDISKRLTTKNSKLIKYLLLALAIFSIIVLFLANDIIIRLFPLWLSVLLIILFYTFHFIKTIEKTCMIKFVEPEELTEGEWINKTIKINSKYICGPKDLGISKEQIETLLKLKKSKKYNKKIEIKIGIPFVPSFLIAYLLAYLLGIGWLTIIM
jgi:hypothetical protein